MSHLGGLLTKVTLLVWLDGIFEQSATGPMRIFGLASSLGRPVPAWDPRRVWLEIVGKPVEN